jgi:7-cyano-7-deazaguanine synthase
MTTKRGSAESVVLVSGGLDSAVTYAIAHNEDEKAPIVFHALYGQHTGEKERDCASALAEHYGAEYIEVDLSDAFDSFGEGLTDDTDLSQHYTEEGVATSYVPMRNTVFLSVASGIAEQRGAGKVWYGPNSEDRQGYADCRDEYAEAIEHAVSLGTDRIEFDLLRPIVDLEKHEIVERGEKLGVPLEHTWSCYQNGGEPCGVCASCEERAEGFEKAGVIDPVR